MPLVGRPILAAACLRAGFSPGANPGPFRDFRFLAPGTRLNAFSEVSGTSGRRRVVRRVDFGECNTQKLILCDLLKNFRKFLPIETLTFSPRQATSVMSWKFVALVQALVLVARALACSAGLSRRARTSSNPAEHRLKPMLQAKARATKTSLEELGPGIM
jgi:hypothetical protein